MKRRTRIFLGLTILVGVAATAFWIFSADDAQAVQTPSVTVTRGDITDRALAVGTIEPRVQVSVKSQLSGVVSRQFAEVGDFVREGAPLLEIRPTPTPQEVANAVRQIELRQIEVNQLGREYDRQRQLFERSLISVQDLEAVERRRDEALIHLQTDRERLELLRSGRMTAGGAVATVIRAPITGFVIDKTVEIGDPVVPLTSYQEGTVLMTMANMDDLLFRGTVDEIDVGRLTEGMAAEIRVGALPDARVDGSLSRIWLKGRRQENANVFPVEVALYAPDADLGLDDSEVPQPPIVLRAGYSANASIIVRRSENVLLIPERVVTFENGSATVNVFTENGATEQRAIKTGLSDAIHIEILEGLAEGDRLAEKPVVQIR
jgi:HlyD family secretion protein